MGGASVAVLAANIWGEGLGPMASAVARAYSGRRGQSLQRGPGAEPLVRREVRGKAP